MKKIFFVTTLVMLITFAPTRAAEQNLIFDGNINKLFDQTIEYINSNEDITKNLIEQIEANEELINTLSTVETELSKIDVKELSDDIKKNIAAELKNDKKLALKALKILGQTKEQAKFLVENPDVRTDLAKKFYLEDDFAQKFLNSLESAELKTLLKLK